MRIKPAPQRRPPLHRTVNPALVVREVSGLVDFLVSAFAASVVKRLAMPDGRVLHAEVLIGDTMVMMMTAKDGASEMPCVLSLYAEDVDGTYARALTLGARSLQPPADQFYGHRTARVADPAGNHWAIHQVMEEPSAEELQRRMAEMARRN
jgi:PhnB protein